MTSDRHYEGYEPHVCGVDGCTHVWFMSPNRHLHEDHGFCRICLKRPPASGETYCQSCIDGRADQKRREQERREKKRVEREQRERRRQWEAILEGNWLMVDWTLASFPADDPVGRAALEAVQPWLLAHTDHRFIGGELVEAEHTVPHSEPGLFIWGPHGAGKTGLGFSCQRARVELRYDGEPEREYPAFANVIELLDEAKAAMRDGDGGAPIRALYASSLLLLDDLGSERPSEWARDAIAALVQHRHSRGLPTIVTSNFAPSALARRLGEGDGKAKPDPMIGKRIVSRLLDNCYAVKLDRPDLRKRAA